jgi:phage-related tail fiber protein
MNFYTLLTTIGQAQLANAAALAVQLPITQFALGDGTGAAITPTESMTALTHEVHRRAVSSVRVDVNNPNWLVIEATIPADVGGWTVREAGAFDAAGNLIAVGSVPDTYKPLLAEGSAREMVFRMVVQLANASNVVLQIDPAIVLASRAYVDGVTATHEAKADPHPQYRRRRPAFDYYRNQL